MNLKNYLIAAFMAVSTLAFSQKDYDVSPTGLRYKIHKDVKGTNAKVGDIVEFHLVNKAENDSVLFTTYDGDALNMPLGASQYGGDVMDGFSMLSKGDSATIWVSVDSIPDFPLIPGVIEKGDYMRYTVKILGVYTELEFQKKQEEIKKIQLAKESKEIEAYFKK